jgi:ribonuclease HII
MLEIVPVRTMFCGVDEAGKGAVLGPLVVAAVACKRLKDFEPIPVRDSKLLSPDERSELYEIITARFPFTTLVIDARDIDILRRCGTMNLVMARAHAAVIKNLRPKKAFVDACDVIASRYGRTVSACLDFPCTVVAEHHADENRPVVSAASIVAKVTRDRLVAGLVPLFGEVGSGYPSDHLTIGFLEGYILDHKRPPSCARASWQTTKDLVYRAEQADLMQFIRL